VKNTDYGTLHHVKGKTFFLSTPFTHVGE